MGLGNSRWLVNLLEATGFVGLDAKQPQLELGGGPGEIHRPIDRVGIAVLVHQSQDLLACFAGRDNKGNLDALARSEGHAPPQAEDRVEDETLAVAGLLKDPHRDSRASARAR